MSNCTHRTSKSLSWLECPQIPVMLLIQEVPSPQLNEIPPLTPKPWREEGEPVCLGCQQGIHPTSSRFNTLQWLFRCTGTSERCRYLWEVQVPLRGAWGDTDTTADPRSQTAVSTKNRPIPAVLRLWGAGNAQAECCLSPCGPAQTEQHHWHLHPN